MQLLVIHVEHGDDLVRVVEGVGGVDARDDVEVVLYMVEQNNSCMFEIPAFLLPTNLGQPMHSPLALMEHVSLNLAGTFLLDPVLLPAIHRK